ncbi:MAG: TIGR01777 family oxidoreductase [Methylococcales bacterium]|nr:TIGR01777 family oxidoreductase [Methylococcales bacterium]
MKLIIVGATGFLGQHLVQACQHQGYEISIVSRSLDKARRLFPKLEIVDHIPAQGSADAIINLAGTPIFDAAWSKKRKQLLWQSRIDLTESLLETTRHWSHPPELWLNASAIGIYGDGGDRWLSESDLATSDPDDFAQSLCLAWEKVAVHNNPSRTLLLRTGLVLGHSGGLLSRLKWVYYAGLGGRLGSGTQWMSWIHIDDWVNAVLSLLNNGQPTGPVNLVAPKPVTNQVFSDTLAHTLKRPARLAQPEWLLRFLLQERADLLLASQRVKPEKLLDAGFRFQYPNLASALKHLLLQP